MQRNFLRALLCASVLTVATPSLAPAQTITSELASEFAPSRVVYVPRDKSLSFRMDQPANKIVVAQTEIAEVIATTDRSFYIRGVQFGATNLLVYETDGQLQQVIDVRVGYDAAGLQDDLRAALPGETIEVRTLGEGLLLAGNVSNGGVEARARLIAENYAPEAVTSALTVSASQQVVLEVRILEASRSALQDIGVDLDIFNDSFHVLSGNGLVGTAPPQTVLGLTGGSNKIDTIDMSLSALEERGIIRTLARPNLVALSGHEASFLAGGEFPFPVPAGRDQVTIEFRPFGVRLNFLPVVQDNGWIRLTVEPVVSQIDSSNSVTVQGLTVPALTVRRAKTTLELRPGDSFSMAGLFQRSYENGVKQLPFLADIPVLGALFRSSRWRRAETELLIIVTARMATDADRATLLINALPGEEPSKSDLLLKGKALDKPILRDAEAAAPPPR